MLDFRLQVFLSVATKLSFTKASEEMFITQPAVTRHIKELESELEVRLFDRVGNKTFLTPAGELLLSYATQILALHNEAKFEISQLKGNAEGVFRIGASTTIAQYVIPPALAGFIKKYPGIKLSMISGNTEYIEKKALKGEIELGIVEGKPSNPDIHYTPFLNDELLVFTSCSNKEIPEEVSNEEFCNIPLVLRERGSGTLDIIGKIIQNRGITLKKLNIAMYLGSTESIKSFIENGQGAGVVSKFAIERGLAKGIFRIIRTPRLQFTRHFYFIMPQGGEPAGVTKLFFNYVEKHYNIQL